MNNAVPPVPPRMAAGSPEIAPTEDAAHPHTDATNAAGASTARTEAPPANALARKRKRALLGLAIAFVIITVLAFVYWFIELRHYQSTDDAYVNGNMVQLTPQIVGTVVSIAADDNDYVRAGQPLIVLSDADVQLALEQAQANLARTVRETRMLFTSTAALQADVRSRETDLRKAAEDFKRRADLAKAGAVSAEEIDHARSTVSAAESALLSTKQKLAGNLAQTEGTALEDHPAVQAAASKLREAYLARQRTVVVAPVSGNVAKRSAQVGQRVQPGVPLMAIISLDHLWVDANFKEGQLGKMRIGQPAELEADIYGGKIAYHGKVAGLSAGTGSAFALLPAQNATGNWIKVVQRLPVRIELDPKEIAAHPLRLGLSMRSKVDVSDQSGLQLSQTPRETNAYATRVYDRDDAAVDALVARIIAANAGGAGAVKP